MENVPNKLILCTAYCVSIYNCVLCFINVVAMLGALGGCYWQPGVGVSDLSPRLGWGQSFSTTVVEPPGVPLLRAALKQEHYLFPAVEAHVRSPREQPPNLVAASNLNLNLKPNPSLNLSTSSTALPCISELRPAFTLHCTLFSSCDSCPAGYCTLMDAYNL